MKLHIKYFFLIYTFFRHELTTVVEDQRVFNDYVFSCQFNTNVINLINMVDNFFPACPYMGIDSQNTSLLVSVAG